MILSILINSVSVYITSKILDGVNIKDFWTAIGVAVLLALVNTFIRPVVIFFSLPLTILTLGLFILVINALMVMLVDYFVEGLKIKSFGWALGFSIIMSIINAILFAIFG